MPENIPGNPENKSYGHYPFRTCEVVKNGKVCGNPRAFARGIAGGKVMCDECAHKHLRKLLKRVGIIIILIAISIAYSVKSDGPGATQIPATDSIHTSITLKPNGNHISN